MTGCKQWEARDATAARVAQGRRLLCVLMPLDLLG